MRFDKYEWTAISIMVSLFILVGFIQGWSVSLVILNMCIISAIMTMGVNISWGYAGVINFGVMGFLAMGGLAAVLVSYPPIKEAWQVGGSGLGISFILLVLLITVVYFINKLVQKKYEGIYEEGFQIGKWTYYDRKGKKNLEEEYFVCTEECAASHPADRRGKKYICVNLGKITASEKF